MKAILLKLGALVAVLAISGLAFAWSGLYSVAATKEHWPITAWFLHFTMESSVETHAAGLQAPPLDDLALIERGAGHYETGCAPCHGAPGVPSNRIPTNMLPNPPSLIDARYDWSPEELFWIVRHGLKYTGMPAWPAPSREDEVWAVAAFLRQLPGMSPEEYATLAKAAAPAGEGAPIPESPGELFSLTDAALIGACLRCHGVDGAGRPSGAFPRIDIQTPDYLVRALDEYAAGIRPSGIMQPIAAALDTGQMQRLARHYSEAAGGARPAEPESAPQLLELGRRIATEGMPEQKIAACSACHGLDEGPRNPQFPALAGQYSGFIAQQLKLWQQDSRGGSAYSELMDAIVTALTEEKILAVAAFYGSLIPAASAETASNADAAPARAEAR